MSMNINQPSFKSAIAQSERQRESERQKIETQRYKDITSTRETTPFIFGDSLSLKPGAGRRGILGGSAVGAASILNQQFLENPVCRQLYTNKLYIITSNNAVAFGNGILLNQNQGTFAVAIGPGAGLFSQGEEAVAIGAAAGYYNQSSETVTIGSFSGYSNQAYDTVFIGSQSGYSGSKIESVNIGYKAGSIDQNQRCTAIGYLAGEISQGINYVDLLDPNLNFNNRAIAIGANAGKCNQYAGGTAIGFCAAASNASGLTSAIGANAGCSNMGYGSVLIGRNAGFQGRGNDISTGARELVGIGTKAGELYAGCNSVAIGYEAGQYRNNSFAVAIGYQAGISNQGTASIAIGYQAGEVSQGEGSIAIGYQAGRFDQSSNCIAIGYQAGYTGQHSNTIIINATSNALNSDRPNAIFINPIRTVNNPSAVGKLEWDPTTKEVINNTSKTFIIDHPIKEDHYLIHACLEGPEAGVFYRGKGEITTDASSTEIILPSYVSKLAHDFTIHLTPYNDNNDNNNTVTIEDFDSLVPLLQHSEIVDSRFKVYGKSCTFSYVVYGKRFDIDVEPSKCSKVLKGDGPYTYLE